MRGQGALILIVLLAGCMGGASKGLPAPTSPAASTADASKPIQLPAPEEKTPAASSPDPRHGTEPQAFDAPVFRAARLHAEAIGGEPSVLATPDGRIYVNHPGCGPRQDPLTECVNGVLWRSHDQARTWTYLNRAPDGRLDAEGHPGNGDADVVADPLGVLYSSNLVSGVEGTGGILLHRSLDHGTTWEYMGNVHPAQDGGDRQWMVAPAPGVLVIIWNEGDGFYALRSTDFGQTFSGTHTPMEDLATLGPLARGADGSLLASYITSDGQTIGARPTAKHSLVVLRSTDLGQNWTILRTGLAFESTAAFRHGLGGFIFPVVDSTGDGTLVLVWAQERVDAQGVSNAGARVMLSASRDQGTTWGPPSAVSDRANTLLPWVSGGAGDRIVVTYYASDVELDPAVAYVPWDVQATVLDGVAGPARRAVHSVVEQQVHLGQICTNGTGCAGSDRSMLDFFENTILPDGRIFVAYTADTQKPVPHTFFIGHRQASIHVAIQEGGTPLWTPVSAIAS